MLPSAFADCTSVLERSPHTTQPPIYGWSRDAVLKPTQTIQSFLVLLHRRSRKRHALRIRLAANLSNAFERASALTIAEHLSSQRGQHVGILDLVGMSLYVWSDHPIRDASALAQSLQDDRPLEGRLVGERSHPPEQSGGELAGVRLELVAIAS
jgi:hypothetical protein